MFELSCAMEGLSHFPSGFPVCRNLWTSVEAPQKGQLGVRVKRKRRRRRRTMTLSSGSDDEEEEEEEEVGGGREHEDEGMCQLQVFHLCTCRMRPSSS